MERCRFGQLLKAIYSSRLDAGWRLGNADLTIICQAPKLAPHITPMRQRIADILQCTIDQVSVKATTTEKLGFTGRKEGIAVQAAVLIESAVSVSLALRPWRPCCRGNVLKAIPADFQVFEVQMHVQPEGEGEHLWLEIEKTGWNTEDVAMWLAKSAGVHRLSVGYSGLKDKHAITRQWFSLHLPGKDDPDVQLARRPDVCAFRPSSPQAQSGHPSGQRLS